MKKILFILIGSALIASCNSNQKAPLTDSLPRDTVATDTVTKKTDTAAANAKPKEAATWSFETDTDKMTSKERYFATVEATNLLNFDAPYDGGSTAKVMLRNQNKVNDVLLQVDKGQFICDITEGCAINVRFDADPAIKFTGTGPSDGSSTVLFITPTKKFITKLKKAKKMIVQAEFYESGLKTMEFNVDGLKWEH